MIIAHETARGPVQFRLEGKMAVDAHEIAHEGRLMRGIIRERDCRETKRKERPQDQVQATKATQVHAACIKATRR